MYEEGAPELGYYTDAPIIQMHLVMNSGNDSTRDALYF